MRAVDKLRLALELPIGAILRVIERPQNGLFVGVDTAHGSAGEFAGQKTEFEPLLICAYLRVSLIETAKPVVETFQMRNAAQRTSEPDLVMLQQTLIERLYGN